MSSIERVVSLSDEQLSHVTRLAEPLAAPDRSAFLSALMSLLRTEPVQPPGDGAVHRAARQLLATGHYARSAAVAIGAVGAISKRKQSKLRSRPAIFA
jgi:hypothetical protein